MRLLAGLPFLAMAGCAADKAARPAVVAADHGLRFSEEGRTSFGTWQADVTCTPSRWRPGEVVDIVVSLLLSPDMLPNLGRAVGTPEAVVLLVTAERCFDGSGILRLPSDERMSTLLTPTGLAIEGGSIGAMSRAIGGAYRSPVDEIAAVPVASLQQDSAGAYALFRLSSGLPADMPPGIYRLRCDFGIQARRRRFSLCEGSPFAGRSRDREYLSCAFSPTIPVSGRDVRGNEVDAARLCLRIYAVLLAQYNSNGSRGVVALEDADHFALSNRNIIPDETVLPLYNQQGKPAIYSLEPHFAADFIDPARNIPWDYASGMLSVQVIEPSGRTIDLGSAPFKGVVGEGPTTGDPRITAWKPSGYGRHTVIARGWINDKRGNRYEWGGTYPFWVANRMTMATATFQGMSFPTGSTYGRDIAFFPAVPADVEVKVDLYPFSDKGAVRSLSYTGRASEAGMFGIREGMKPFALDAPGEYHARILARYEDAAGNLWVCSLRHAGVVFTPDTPLIAHGKRLKIGDQFAERGGTGREGYIEPGEKTFRHLEHIAFPYRSGDVLLIAAEGQGANKIEPVLTFELPGEAPPPDRQIQGIGMTNVKTCTSNGLSPHLYPEYITDRAYYYAAAPRPGFPSRFLVAEDGVQAPYWPTSATNFGGQIGASPNGDSPGDIYRLVGGVVLRPKGGKSAYAGYLASAFILPANTRDNRVVAPGSIDLFGADGRKARFFLVPVRPGTVFEQGAPFVPAFQIDPLLPAHISFSLTSPTGRVYATDGTADQLGSFAGREKWVLDEAGVYEYTVKADWRGSQGFVPGLRDGRGYLFVAEKGQKDRRSLSIETLPENAFSIDKGLLIMGTSTASRVYFTVIMPGVVIDQGEIRVVEGRFSYRFDPVAVSRRIPIYDIENRKNGRREAGRVVHLSFFSEEHLPDGGCYHDFVRVILRGTRIVSVK